MTQKKSKGAIIGFGNIALLGHLPAFKALGVDIVAAVDVCEKRRDAAEKEGLSALRTLDELEGLDIDFIDICTPPSARFEPIRYAIERGLDVVCEKPVSTPGDFSKIKRLVLGSDVFVYPVHNWKHAPHYVKVKEMVVEKGGIENLQMNTMRTTYSSGNTDWNPAWRVDKKISGGGIIMDHGYHNIYLAMHLFGSDFERAVLEDIDYYESNPGVEKRACFSLEFPGKRKATITLDWGASTREIKNTIYECNSRLELSDKRIINSDHVYEFEESLSGDSVHGRWYVPVFKDFLKQRKTKDKTHFKEAMKVLEGIDSLYQQARK